ncbi:MAG: TonB-dependent receptor domain-containing protein [Pseudomonadota bacterium]
MGYSRTPLLVAGLLLSSGAAIAAEQPMEEIVVVGTQIKGAQITDALPVSVITELDIEALGVNSGDELLEYIVEQGQNYFSESENISGGVNSARGDIGAFNLRNLGTGNTLVLLNGRRMVNAASYQTEEVGGSFVPVNTVNAQSLPVTGLRRAEVLRDGASAIYGADAVAGVVNYVLKNDYEGFRVRVRYDDYDNIPRTDQRLTLEWGKVLDGGTSVGAFVNFYHRDRVNSQDDPKWADSDLRPLVTHPAFIGNSAFNNTSANSEYGQYDAVSSVSGTGLSGVITDSAGEFETYPAGDPRCQYDIGYGTCGGIDGQGTYRYNQNENRDLYSELDRVNLYAYINHDFASGMESFTEFTAYLSETNTFRQASTTLSAVAPYRVAANNYYNPLGPCGSPNRLPDSVIGTNVPCSGIALSIDNYRWTHVPRIVDVDGDVYRIVTGLRGNLDQWDWESAITWSRATRDDITHNRISNTLLQNALNDPTPTAFNPFSGRENSNIEQMLVDVYRKNEQELTMFDFKISNPSIFELPAGPVGLLAGFEYRDESFSDDRDPRLDGTINYVDNSGNTYPFVSDVLNSSPTADSAGDRQVTSLFTEIAVPVLRNLDVQAAVRYEDFSDVGSTTVGRVAFGYRPLEQILVRGSWSQAFRAPNLVTINESIVARSNTLDDVSCFFVDPNETELDCTYGIQRTAQGSKQLKPEESVNTSFGFVFEPGEGVTLTVDFWKIEKDDTIGLFGEENHIALDLLLRLQAGTSSCAAVVGNPAVVRDPATLTPAAEALWLAAGACPGGEIIRVEDNYANLDTRTVAGYDIGLYYEVDTDFGNFDFQIIGTWLDKYEQSAGVVASQLVEAQANGTLPASVPVVGFANLIRQDGNPETKQNMRLSWRKGDWGASVTGIRYGDFIQTSLTLADGTQWVIPPMATYNLSVDYKFKVMGESDARVRFGANNFTNKRAPLADDSFGYNADMHSDLGRYYYLDLQLTL